MKTAAHSDVPPAMAAPGTAEVARLTQVEVVFAEGGRKTSVLRGVDLHLRAGEPVALVGPSGSGKTTLLMVLAGLEKPTSGQAQVMGVDIGAAGEDALAVLRRRHVGIVFQAFHLVPTLTALENVMLPLDFREAHLPATERRARAVELLDQVGLSHRHSHYPGQLSGGEQQRVALARAFVTHPALVLADEPTGNLDQTTAAAVIDLMFSMQARYATTLLLITHDPTLAARCGRTLHMQDGRVVG